MSATTDTITRLTTTTGATLFTCTDDEGARWCLAHLLDADGTTRAPVSALPDTGACVACAWCGRVLSRPAPPARCSRHTACPQVDMLASDFAVQAVRKLRRWGAPELTPTGWAYLAAALELHGADVPAAVAVMLRMEPEWSADRTR